MIKPLLLAVALVALVTANAAAQPYYSYYPPSYDYPGYGYAYPYPYYSPPYYYPYAFSAYRPAPAYSDPYVALRPYSDRAGPAASGHTGY